jgi:hypothetical protein
MNSIQRSIQKAKKALKYYLNGAEPENNLAVRDLLADVKHYCDAHKIDFYAELETAHRHYTEEVVEARRAIKERSARCPKAKDKFRHFLHQPKAQRRLNTMTNAEQSKQKFLVISYDDDQQQWFYDFVAAASEQAAIDKVCTKRYYVIAADALSPENLNTLAQSLNEETIESIEESERADSNLEVR